MSKRNRKDIKKGRRVLYHKNVQRTSSSASKTEQSHLHGGRAGILLSHLRSLPRSSQLLVHRPVTTALGTGEKGSQQSACWNPTHRAGRITPSQSTNGLPGGLSSQEYTCQCRKHRFDSWVRKIPWIRKWQSASEFSPGEFHGQRSLANCTVQGVVKSPMWLSTHRYPGSSMTFQKQN